MLTDRSVPIRSIRRIRGYLPNFGPKQMRHRLVRYIVKEPRAAVKPPPTRLPLP